MKAEPVATGVWRLDLGFVNAWLLETSGRLVLVDCGTRPDAERIAAAVAGLGRGEPVAIVLTHVHADHAGSAAALARRWRARVHAADADLPVLRGQVAPPSPDHEIGGPLAFLSRFAAMDLEPVPDAKPASACADLHPEWTILPAPGHSPGHSVLWRSLDRTLIAGDALSAVDTGHWFRFLLRTPGLYPPPLPTTADFPRAADTLRMLAALDPARLLPGHGAPSTGGDLAERLRHTADLTDAWPGRKA